MRHANDVVNVGQRVLEHLVHDDAAHVGEAVEGVLGEAGLEAHGAGVQDGLVAQAGRRLVAVHNVHALADKDVAKDGEEAVVRRQGRGAVQDQRREVVHLDAVGQEPHALAVSVRVRDNDHLSSHAPDERGWA